MIRNQYIGPSRWHVPVLSLILGLFLGLLIGWVLWPVEWTNNWPTDLSEPAKADYLAAVADAYVASGGSDDGKALAQDRLRTMQENLAEEINTAKRHFINNGPSNIRVSNLEQLATALGAETIVGTLPVEPEVTVPDAIQPVPETDAIVSQPADQSGFVDWTPWLLALLSGLVVLLLALYFISWLIKRNGQDQGRQPKPEPEPYADNFLESVRDQPDVDSEDDYDFYEEEIDDDLWREGDGHHRSQTAKFIPEPEPAGAPANYGAYTQRQISHPQTPRRGSVAAITTAVAATTGPRIDNRQIDNRQSARQQTADQVSYPSRRISEESVEYRVEGGTEDFSEESFEDFTESFTERFAEESDDVMIDKSINELNQGIEDVPIYRQGDRRNDRQSPQETDSFSTSQPMLHSGGIESLPSEVKSERPSPRQSQSASPRTIDEARLKTPRPAALIDAYTVHYHIGEPDYEDSYEIEAEDGSHIGIVGMGIDGMGGILDQKPEQVIVLDVWLNDTISEETLTQLLLSKYAQQYGAGDTSRTDRPLLPAQMGLHFQLKSENVLLDCEVTEVHFVKNHGTPDIFQSLTLKMDVYQNSE